MSSSGTIKDPIRISGDIESIVDKQTGKLLVTGNTPPPRAAVAAAPQPPVKPATAAAAQSASANPPEVVTKLRADIAKISDMSTVTVTIPDGAGAFKDVRALKIGSSLNLVVPDGRGGWQYISGGDLLNNARSITYTAADGKINKIFAAKYLPPGSSIDGAVGRELHVFTKDPDNKEIRGILTGEGTNRYGVPIYEFARTLPDGTVQKIKVAQSDVVGLERTFIPLNVNVDPRVPGLRTAAPAPRAGLVNVATPNSPPPLLSASRKSGQLQPLVQTRQDLPKPTILPKDVHPFVGYPDGKADPTYISNQRAAAKISDSYVAAPQGSYRDFQEMNNKMHEVSAIGPDTANPQVYRNGRYSTDSINPGKVRQKSYMPVNRPRKEDLAKLFRGKPIVKNLAITELDIPDIPSIHRPLNDGLGIHIYPDHEGLEYYFKSMYKSMGEYKAAIQQGKKDLAFQKMSEYYRTAINARPYEQVNQSMFMNQLNSMLKQMGYTPVPHWELDHLAQRLSQRDFDSVLRDYVNNPQVFIEKYRAYR